MGLQFTFLYRIFFLDIKMIYPATNYYLLMGCTVRNKIQTSELSNVFLDSSALGNLKNNRI